MGVLNRRYWLCALGLVLLGLAGCSFGPTALERNRTKYNEAIRETWNEQFLLNLVRLRYRDPTQFDAVTNILSQHQFTAGLSEQEQFRTGAGHLGNGGIGAASQLYSQYLLAPAAAITETPIITFSPLEGADFTKSLLTQIHLDTLVLLSNTGWDVDRVMRLCVSQINRIENVTQLSGELAVPPRYEQFAVLARRMRELQIRGWLELGYDETDKNLSERITLEKDLLPRDALEAAAQKVKFQADGKVDPKKPGDKVVILHGKEKQTVERIAPEAWGEPCGPLDVATMLQVTPGLEAYPLTWAAESGQLKKRTIPGPDIVISTRSVLGMMLLASRAVAIPRKHLEAGLVRDPVDAQGQPFDWTPVVGDLLRVQVQKTKPAHAFVSTHYRGHWFYIDDADLNSKSSFALIQLVTGLELAGGVVPGPVVTVSSGAGASVIPGSGGGGGKGGGGGGAKSGGS